MSEVTKIRAKRHSQSLLLKFSHQHDPKAEECECLGEGASEQNQKQPTTHQILCPVFKM